MITGRTVGQDPDGVDIPRLLQYEWNSSLSSVVISLRLSFCNSFGSGCFLCFGSPEEEEKEGEKRKKEEMEIVSFH